MEIALLWDSKLLFERYLAEHVHSCARIEPLVLASPFAPKPKVLMIPTGFGEPKYTGIGRHLSNIRGKLRSFTERGGVLVVFGATKSMKVDFLPEPIEYVSNYEVRALTWADDSLPHIVDEPDAECDGYLIAREKSGWKTLCTDESGMVVAASLECGNGIVIVTSIHEVPTPGFLKGIVDLSRIS
ncbi:MAG: hypothetical protein ACXQT1_00120 [Methermicoccaceae archaeon]